MPFNSTAISQMLDALNGGSPSSIIAYASLHSAYSSSGASELTGGSPAYARQAVTWNAASAGSKTAASIAGIFNVPASSTVAFIGHWSAVSGGTFADMGANGGATLYAATITLASPGLFTAPGSSYSNGATVVVWAGAGDTLPVAFTAGTIYYVVNAAGATFNLSATSGGAGINTAAAGGCLIQQITTEIYGAQGTFTLSSDSLSLF